MPLVLREMSRAGRWAENWGKEGGRDSGGGDAWTQVKKQRGARPPSGPRDSGPAVATGPGLLRPRPRGRRIPLPSHTLGERCISSR